MCFSFFFAVFSPLRFCTFTLQALKGLAHLFLYFFFGRFYFGNNLVFLLFLCVVTTFSYIHFIFANAFAFAFFAVAGSISSAINSSLSLFILVFVTSAFAFFLLFLKLTKVYFLTHYFRTCELLVLSFNHTCRDFSGEFFLRVMVLLFLLLLRSNGLCQWILISRFILLSVGFVVVFFLVLGRRLRLHCSRSCFLLRGCCLCFRSSYFLFWSSNFCFRRFLNRSYPIFSITSFEVYFTHRFESSQLSFSFYYFLLLLFALLLVFFLLLYADSLALFAFVFHYLF